MRDRQRHGRILLDQQDRHALTVDVDDRVEDLLDEPSMGLAPVLVEQIFDTIIDINRQGMTILLVEQNAAMALSIAHRGYVLETGSIALTGTAAELSGNADVRRAYLGE